MFIAPLTTPAFLPPRSKVAAQAEATESEASPAAAARRPAACSPEPARVAQLLPGFERELPDIAWFQRSLAEHGYETPRHGQWDEATRRVVAAFQMRYRPSRFDGQRDAETAALLAALLQQEAALRR